MTWLPRGMRQSFEEVFPDAGPFDALCAPPVPGDRLPLCATDIPDLSISAGDTVRYDAPGNGYTFTGTVIVLDAARNEAIVMRDGHDAWYTCVGVERLTLLVKAEANE